MEQHAVEAALAAALQQFSAGEALLVAVSGGADSTALLHGASRLASARSLSLSCLHVDHGLRPRPEIEGDVAHVRGLCAELAVPFLLERLAEGSVAALAQEKGIGIEAAARDLRHAAFRRHAAAIQAAAILIGHSADDRTETLLMRFLRGAGPEGLHPMPAESGQILRPFASLTRAQIVDYLHTRGVSWRDDSTNTDMAYLRNRVRHELIPFLDGRFPFWRGGVAAFAATQEKVSDFIKEEAGLRLPFQRDAASCLSWDAEVFFSAPLIVREQAVFEALDALEQECGGAVGRAFRRAALELFCSQRTKDLDLGGYHLRQSRSRVTLQRDEPWSAQGFACRLEAPGTCVIAGCRVEAATRGSGCRARLPLVIRSCDSRDRILRGGVLRLCKSLRPTACGASSSRSFVIEDIQGIVLFACREGDADLQVWIRDAVGTAGNLQNECCIVVTSISEAPN